MIRTSEVVWFALKLSICVAFSVPFVLAIMVL